MKLTIEIREIQDNKNPFLLPVSKYDFEIEKDEYNVRINKNLGIKDMDRLYELSLAIKQFINDYYQAKKYPNPSFHEPCKIS